MKYTLFRPITARPGRASSCRATGRSTTRSRRWGGSPGLGAITDCGVQYWDPVNLEWKRAIIELPDNERGFTALFHSDGYLFAGGLGGVWRISDEILSAPGDGDNPHRLDLSTTGEN